MARHNIDNLSWREVVWQRPYEQDKVHELLAHLAVLTPRGAVIFESRSHGGFVKHYIGADSTYISKIENTIKIHGDIRTYPVENHIRIPVNTARQLTVSHPGLSLNTEVTSATIRAGLAALAAVRGEEESVVQIVLGGSFKPKTTPRNLPNPHESWLQTILQGVEDAPLETRNSIKEKNSQHCFEACIRIGVSGERQTGRLNAIISAFRTLESAGVHVKASAEKSENLNSVKVPWHFPLRLSIKELTAFTLLPFGEEELPGTSGLHPRLTLPPKWYQEPTNRIHDRTFANSTEILGSSSKLSISPQDSLEHTILLGPTGAGKSTAMLSLILADIYAGRSVIVLDPKADLINSILERVPGERAKDVVVIDLSDPSPVGFMSNSTMLNTAQALMDTMTPKFAVSYLRVSTRGQAERGGGHDEGFSIPAQREANKKKALSIGAIVGKEFVDRGASAKSADRPQLQAMLEYVKENADRVDYVIVHKVDRLARNRDDDSDIMRVLRECGVQLVSASESIDDTPAGMLLHGIMSSIAEFYSQNLATEVKKGMGEKIKGGGTVGRAPIGYQNVRYVDDKGREERTVIIDPERAPLIKLAFEEYATGNWTVADLADHLAACGLNTRATPKIPSQPVNLKTLHKVLVNPYYKGIVKYKGVEYQGSHEALVDTEMWDKVQSILASRLNGERSLKHPHFLKGSVYCAYCGERMLVTNVTKKNGMVYPYFYCAGRHSGRRKDCKTHSVLISVVEEKIEKIYDSYQLPSDVRQLLEVKIELIIANEKAKYDKELDGLKGQKAKLENKRKKLLEAHYSDAIPLDLLKSEQQKIAKELAAIEHELKMHDMTFEQVKNNLRLTLDIVENCGDAYHNASDTVKKLMNQAIFNKIYIISNDEIDLDTEVSFRPPFDKIIDPIKEDIAQINRNTNTDRTNTSIEKAKGHIQEFLECGLSDVDNPSNISTYPNNEKFFGHNSLSKALLVDGAKIKALSKETFQAVCARADVVLVEADGSKQLPLKYPNSSEPVIPEHTDEIIVVCGLNAIGQRAKDVCHRLELVKQCLGIADDTIITPEHVRTLVTEGYLRPLRKAYPDKRVTLFPRHDGSPEQKAIAAMLQAE